MPGEGGRPSSIEYNGPLQGYLAHKKLPPSLGPPQGPRHSPTIESKGVAVSCGRGNPVEINGPTVVGEEVVQCGRAPGQQEGLVQGLLEFEYTHRP